MIDRRRVDATGTVLVKESEQVKWLIKPRHRWVLLKEMTQEEQRTAGGVILPGADFFLNEKSPKHTIAKIVEKSPEIVDLEIGDIVIATKFSLLLEDLEYFTGTKEFKLCRDEEIFASVIPKC